MSIDDFFNKKLDEIAEVSGVDRNLILSKSKELDVVDARHIFIKIMSDCGLSSKSIGRVLDISSRNVQYVLQNFESRIKFSKWARRTYEIVKK